MREKRPATISSAITNNAPFLSFNLLIGYGFKMSKSLNKRNANKIQKGVYIIYGFDKVINIPIVSSITIEEWSFPFLASYLLIDGMLVKLRKIAVKIEINQIYSIGESNTNNAGILPKVPGANFIFPI